MIYWDHNSTSPLRPKVKEAMQNALDLCGANPSSTHSLGQKCRNALERARRTIAETIGAQPSELVFTASATESNIMALHGLWEAGQKARPQAKKILVSPLEHNSVYANVEYLAERDGAEVVYTPLRENGLIDLEACEKILSAGDVSYCTLLAANNETGVIQPWQELGEVCQKHAVPYHSDLVQYFGRLPMNLNESPCDLATVCFHKAGGPKGVGLFYVKKGAAWQPVIRGGTQEKQRRAGTENLIAILGAEALANEASELIEIYHKQVKVIRDAFEEKLLEEDIPHQVVGKDVPRLPNTSYVVFDKIRSDAMLMGLDAHEVCASSGSACSSGLAIPSRVLMNLDYSKEEAVNAIRFSLGVETSFEAVNDVVGAIKTSLKRLSAA